MGNGGFRDTKAAIPQDITTILGAAGRSASIIISNTRWRALDRVALFGKAIVGTPKLYPGYPISRCRRSWMIGAKAHWREPTSAATA